MCRLKCQILLVCYQSCLKANRTPGFMIFDWAASSFKPTLLFIWLQTSSSFWDWKKYKKILSPLCKMWSMHGSEEMCQHGKTSQYIYPCTHQNHAPSKWWKSSSDLSSLAETVLLLLLPFIKNNISWPSKETGQTKHGRSGLLMTSFMYLFKTE